MFKVNNRNTYTYSLKLRTELYQLLPEIKSDGITYPALLKHPSDGVSLRLAEVLTKKPTYKYCKESTFFKPLCVTKCKYNSYKTYVLIANLTASPYTL